MNRVLVVDDEPQLLELLSLTLGLRGYEVRTATGGAEAIDLARRERVDLAVLDVLMSPMSGFDTARALRALPFPPRILFLTGLDDRANGDLGRTLGDAYLTKPFRVADLVAAIEGVLAP